MWDAITSQFKKELAVVKKAPFACLVTSVVLGIMWVYAFHWSMVAVISMKDDLIKAQEQQIAKLNVGKSGETEVSAKKDSRRPLEVIEKKTFINEKVLLDGYKYVDCIFDNVSIVYNGGFSEVINTRVIHPERLIFRSESPTVNQLIKIFRGMGAFRPGFLIELDKIG